MFHVAEQLRRAGTQVVKPVRGNKGSYVSPSFVGALLGVLCCAKG
jgi:hypothetical protein